MSDVRRREFITLLGGAAAVWPLAVRAHQSAVPVVGFVYTSQTSSEASPFVSAFQQGLRETGFIEGQNVAVEYRWPGGQYDRLPGLAAELVNRQVAVIVGDTTPAMAAKTATSFANRCAAMLRASGAASTCIGQCRPSSRIVRVGDDQLSSLQKSAFLVIAIT